MTPFSESEFEAAKRAGAYLRWRSSGDTSCDACFKLNGTVVQAGEPFHTHGKSVPTEYRTVYHPPLHPNCECGVEVLGGRRNLQRKPRLSLTATPPARKSACLENPAPHLACSIAMKSSTKFRWLRKDASNRGNVLAYADPLGGMDSIDEGAASVTFVVSAAERDRDGDVLVPSGCRLDDYRRLPVWFWDHRQDPAYTLPIGTAEDPKTKRLSTKVEADRVLNTIWFDQGSKFAMEVFRLVSKRLLRAASVGFLPVREYMDELPGGGSLIRQWNKLESSVVGIGAHPDALATELGKGYSAIVCKALAPFAAKPKRWLFVDGARVGVISSKAIHKYSSTQFNLADCGYSRSQGSPIPALKELQSAIDNADLADDGKEKEFHVTVKYGLHTNDPEDVREVVRAWVKKTGRTGLSAELGSISLFPAKEGVDCDVVKIDVNSADLRSLNKALCELSHTDKHTYNPHVTLAYVGAGLGRKYVGKGMGGHTVLLNKLVFSDADGKKTAIDLRECKAPREEAPVASKSLDVRVSPPVFKAVNPATKGDWREDQHPRDHGKFSSNPAPSAGEPWATPVVEFLKQSAGRGADGETLQAYRDLHRMAVEGALAAQKPVPPEVLSSYPDLAGRYSKEPPAHESTLRDYLSGYDPSSNSGRKFAAEHRVAVEAALAAGKPVAPEVLADYPDLAAKYPGKKGLRLPPVFKSATVPKCGGVGGTPGPCPRGGRDEGGKPAGGQSSNSSLHATASDPAKLDADAEKKAGGILSRIASFPAKLVPQAVKNAAKAARDWAVRKLTERYGERTAGAIMKVAVLSAPVPLPGSQPAAIALSLVVAEGVRLFQKMRGAQAKATSAITLSPEELVAAAGELLASLKEQLSSLETPVAKQFRQMVARLALLRKGAARKGEPFCG